MNTLYKILLRFNVISNVYGTFIFICISEKSNNYYEIYRCIMIRTKFVFPPYLAVINVHRSGGFLSKRKRNFK